MLSDEHWSVIYVKDALRAANDRMLEQSQREEEERRQQLLQELVGYRATYQRPEDSRDADLTYDRQGALAFNLSIPESELGPASMQVFKVCVGVNFRL